MSQIAIYQSDSGTVEVRLQADTVWLSLQQIAELFGRDKSVISRHLRNVFSEGELVRDAVVAKNATTAADGNKRSGAFLFVDFLHRNRRLLNAQGEPVINDVGLAALALLVAESDPAQKDVLIRLVVNLLAQGGRP